MTATRVTALLLTLFLMVGCGKRQEKRLPPPAIKVSATTVETGDIRQNLSMSGNLHFIADTTVSSQVSAQVKTIDVRDGQPVTKGQTLLTFDDSIIRAVADQARGTLQKNEALQALGKVDLEKNMPLVESGAISQLTYEQKMSAFKTAQGQVEADKGALNKALEDLKQTVVTAPITGVLSNRFVEKGDWVSTGGKLFQVSDYITVYLETYLSDKDVAKLNFGKLIHEGVGIETEVMIDSLPGKKFEGRIGYIQPVTNLNQLFQVRIYIENPDLKLLEGMYARGRVLVNRIPDVVRIPISALLEQVRTNESNSVVRVDKHNRAEITRIRIGVTDNLSAQVMEGLTPGDLVVIEGKEVLSNGQPLEIASASDVKS
ncbi:MAG: efflux RND transporter periplasmic adaptor subunit [Deltaproteobacteria bacterium]|nr:efflux RND transporter periplasmic adaptor subunit [Deltaproteobacteria bacterium]